MGDSLMSVVRGCRREWEPISQKFIECHDVTRHPDNQFGHAIFNARADGLNLMFGIVALVLAWSM